MSKNIRTHIEVVTERNGVVIDKLMNKKVWILRCMFWLVVYKYERFYAIKELKKTAKNFMESYDDDVDTPRKVVLEDLSYAD